MKRKNILFITTSPNTGSSVYAILPKLSKINDFFLYKCASLVNVLLSDNIKCSVDFGHNNTDKAQVN